MNPDIEKLLNILDEVLCSIHLNGLTKNTADILYTTLDTLDTLDAINIISSESLYLLLILMEKDGRTKEFFSIAMLSKIELILNKMYRMFLSMYIAKINIRAASIDDEEIKNYAKAQEENLRKPTSYVNGTTTTDNCNYPLSPQVDLKDYNTPKVNAYERRKNDD